MRRRRLTITLQDDIINKLDRFIDGDKIRNRSHAIEVLLSKKFKSNLIKKAIILGGGAGINVGNQEVPKLLLPLGRKTLIERNIETLKKYGITDLILSLSEDGAQIREKLGDGSKYGIKVIYFERDFGRGSVLRQAISLLEEETFLMMNGDILLKDIDIKDMYYFHKNNKAKGTILLTATSNPTDLGLVFMKGNHITRFEEKFDKSLPPSNLINAGVYLFEPSVCNMVSTERYSVEGHILPTLAEEGSLLGYMLDNPWIHLHDKECYEKYLKRKTL